MEQIIEKNKCCGCHACLNICPKSAIKMVEDERGFKYPIIDPKKCINCGLCKKTCPIINSHEGKKKNVIAFAAYNKNFDERKNSSSGGIFILIAKAIIKKNGVVFGATFDKEFNVVHSYIESEKDISKLMGSKYTQSNIEKTYVKVKEFLDEDRYVLFTGTPCQVEGLFAFLKKDYKKLFTQDIICHGVGAPKVWRKYLEYQKKKYDDEIKTISFRNKDKGWSLFRMKIKFKKHTYSKDLTQDIYLQFFLKNICLRESCYNCSFKKKYRNSDITLADFWGISNIHPDMNDNMGTSLVIVNTEKGNELFNSIRDSIVYKETDINKAIKYNPALTVSANHNQNENEFANHIDNMTIQALFNKYIPKPSLLDRIKTLIKRFIK